VQKGMLNIHEYRGNGFIKSTLRIEGGKLFVESHFTILLDEHKITIPDCVQKIAKEVTVEVKPSSP